MLYNHISLGWSITVSDPYVISWGAPIPYLIHKLMVDLSFVDPVFTGILLRELNGVALKGDVGRKAQVLPNALLFECELPMTLAKNGLAGNEGLEKVRRLRKKRSRKKS